MPDLDIPTDAPVLVTGATGYVAGRVVERLLQEGLTVHATVRDASKTERLQYLNDLADGNPGTLRFFSADLLKPGSFAEAMEGCSVVFHIASPFIRDAADPQKDLIDPAVNGTTNVLTSVNETESVKRVVLTSSCAAIYGDNIDVAATPRGLLDEDVWNTTATLDHNPYFLSKTLAEREAWKLADAQDRWRLVTINPSMVMGPGVKVHGSSESFHLLEQLVDGSLGTGMPDLGMGVVDVREVAEAHVRAAFLPDAEGRHILSAHDSGLPQMVEALRPTWGSRFKLPPRIVPKWLLWLVAPVVGLTRTYVSKNVGHPWKADHSKSVDKLGIQYRPLPDTMNDFMEQLVEAGALTPA